MSVVVMLEFKASDDAYEAMKQRFSEILGDTARFDGCEGLYAAADDKNRSVVLYEVWDELASQKKYMGWRQETGLMDTMGPMLREPPSVRTMDVLPF